jgi:hypothetical protein
MSLSFVYGHLRFLFLFATGVSLIIRNILLCFWRGFISKLLVCLCGRLRFQFIGDRPSFGCVCGLVVDGLFEVVLCLNSGVGLVIFEASELFFS